MTARITVLVLFVGLLAGPFLLRPAVDPPPADARQLIIITPHNEQIRTEFARAFDAWHQAMHGERVEVVYNVPGGTSEIRKMLQAQYGADLQAGRAPGGTADLMFGGGSYEHGELKRGVEVDGPDGARTEPITAPVALDAALLRAVYGDDPTIAGVPLFDPDGYWHGTALSAFGIVFNRDALARLGLDDPQTWADLCRPELRGWVALVNPGQSGSVTTAFDALLQYEGWERGWAILRRGAANARYFSGSSLKPPADVTAGDAAMGVCIDFYGRYQAQAMAVIGDPDRVGYVDPPGATTIDPDPISMLRGAPSPILARRFIEFCLSPEGQALWQFRIADRTQDGRGPLQFELRRLMIRRDMYERFAGRAIDDVNPYASARPPDDPDRNVRAFVAPLFAAIAMDHHEALVDAWTTIVEHPAYPDGRALVMAEDVSDPELADLLRRFDAMPSLPDPDGNELSLASRANLSALKRGWLRDGWADAGLWPSAATGERSLRREAGAFFGAMYDGIREGD